MAIALSTLSALFGTSSAGAGGSLLSTLYSFTTQTTNVLGQNPIAALQSAETNEVQDVKATAAQPAVQRAIKAFTAGVMAARSVRQLLANPAVMSVLMTANGLGDQLTYNALAQRTLSSNVHDPKSLANTLTDARWKPVVQTYDLANKGLSVIQDPKVIGTIANAYAEVTWRQSLDATTPGLSNALTFRAEARNITSVDQILGDPIMRKVVTTALGIPQQIAFQPLEAQEKAISTRLDITQFKKPQFVDSFTQRYLIAANQAASSSTIGTPPSIMSRAVAATGLVI